MVRMEGMRFLIKVYTIKRNLFKTEFFPISVLVGFTVYIKHHAQSFIIEFPRNFNWKIQLKINIVYNKNRFEIIKPFLLHKYVFGL